jgi:hypothetical protein
MGGANAFIEAVSSGATLININDTISGAGMIGTADGHLTLVNSGVVNANNSVSPLTIGDNTISGATIAASSLIEVINGTTLALSGGKLAAGAIVETLSGGQVFVNGALANSGGTLFASGSGSVLQIVSGAVVSGGKVEIGNGIVEVQSGGTASVVFLSTGNGGLELDGLGSAFTGRVSGFGGSNHSNHDQFIAFAAVGSGASVTYTSAASHISGTLMVSGRRCIGDGYARRQLLVGELLQRHGQRPRHHHRPRCSQRRHHRRRHGRRRGAAQRHRSAERGLRRADDARLFGEQHRHRRNAHGYRRPPCCRHRAPRQLHGGKLRYRGRRPWRHTGHGSANTAAAEPSTPLTR